MTLYETITAAIRDITLHGFDSQERIDDWMTRIRAAASAELLPEAKLNELLRSTMKGIYTRLVERGTILQYHGGVSRFRLEQLRPHLRAELDRRVMASANLIKLNRDQSISNTLQRFSGWATSIPVGGSKATDKADTNQGIRKRMKALPFEERRVLIDQGHKLTASLNDVIAKDNNALAGVWHSNWKQVNYNYREDHKHRDGKVYLIRGSWAAEKGLVKPGPAGWLDQITQPAEEPFCRCHMSYLYTIRSIPDDMLTDRGRAELERVRAELRK